MLEWKSLFLTLRIKKCVIKLLIINSHALEFVSNCCKIQKTCNKVVDTYPYAIKFVSECYNTQKNVMKLLILAILYLILFLVDIRFKKCGKK